MTNNKLIAKYTEMHLEERAFVLEKIKELKPKKILTVGIASGSNEVLILDYLEKNKLLDEVEFYSIDYNTYYYKDNAKRSGFLIDELVPHLKKYHKLYTPGLALNYIKDIGKDIDFLLIDTVHSVPGEALDFLMILPYLKENANILMHDLSMHVLCETPFRNVCAILFLAFEGEKHYLKKKYTPYDPYFQSIGSCTLASNQMQEYILERYFRVLSLPWLYFPSDEELSLCASFIKEHYTKDFYELFLRIIDIQKDFKTKGLLEHFDQWNQSYVNEVIKKAFANKMTLQEYIINLENNNTGQKEDFEQRLVFIKEQVEKDFNQKALSIKSHLSYQLGQALIKAYKNKWGGGFVKFLFEAYCIVREFKKRKGKEF